MAGMEPASLVTVIIVFVLKFHLCVSMDWDQVRCSSDINQEVQDGKVDIGRFPWLGVVQHIFELAEGQQFAVTTGILIHPAYAIAAAEDVVRIPRERLLNTTKFIVWHSDTIKYAIDVRDYLIHPEYEEKVTFATLALLELYTAWQSGLSDMAAVVLPVCLPVKGFGSFDSLYGAYISDDNGEIGKEMFKMNYVPNKECEEYYYKNELSYEMMKPRKPLCVKTDAPKPICVWDSGVALITKMSWGFWTLLGFSMRGPGCGAPSRFVKIIDYLPWIDDVLDTTAGGDQELIKINFRRQNPHEIEMYAADVKLPKEIGVCHPKARGTVLYKENSEIITTKNFAQGFFYLSVHQVASFRCVTVTSESTARSNLAMWVESVFYPDTAAYKFFQLKLDYRWRPPRLECFEYYRTGGYIEFRFYFSFRASFDITMYGAAETKYQMPQPWDLDETTDPWWPTDTKIRPDTFWPLNKGIKDAL